MNGAAIGPHGMEGTEMREITILPDEQYGGHWIETDSATYYFSQGTTLAQVFDMLENEGDDENVGKH
jgi:hypothetical protein